MHRDVKARNILLTGEGEVKLGDFGFSQSQEKISEAAETCVGSPSWMAPEIIVSNRNNEKYDSRVDVWALGITAIELGDGEAPYASMHPTRVLFQIVTNPPPVLGRPYNWSENYSDFINESVFCIF